MNIAKGDSENVFAKIIDLISKENEIQRIIAEYSSSTKSVEEIGFTRATCKSDRLITKFKNMVQSGKFEESDIKYEDVKNNKDSSDPMESLDENGRKAMEKIRKILADCWNGDDFSRSENKVIFEEIIKGPQERKIFGECFNFYRTKGLFSLTDKAFLAFSNLMECLMKQLTKEEDIDCALRLLILSQTYYIESRSQASIKQERIFLQQAIQKDPFWQRAEFWERAIKSGVEEDDKAECPEGETKEEFETRMQNAAFGKLITFAHNMIHFDISQEIVEPIIIKFAKSRNLSEQLIFTLKVHKTYLFKHAKSS